MDIQEFFILFMCTHSISCLTQLELCNEVPKFFPNFCEYPLAVKHCANSCDQTTKDSNLLHCGREPSIYLRRRRHRRIVGGRAGIEGQWPWHVSLRMNDHHECGATILSNHLLITAAHCFDDNYTSTEPSNFSIVAGAFKKSVLGVKQQLLNISKIMRPRGYKVDFYPRADLNFVVATDDVAIIETNESIMLQDDNKDAICLPDEHNLIPDNYSCFIVGWGLRKFPNTKRIPNKLYPEELNYAEITTVSTSICNQEVSFNNTINSTMTICAGDSNATTSPCNKDSGGSLACKKNGVWYINGIISSGFKCGGPDAYSLYTNIRNYKRWMLETLFNDTSSTSGNDTSSTSGNDTSSTSGSVVNCYHMYVSFSFVIFKLFDNLY